MTVLRAASAMVVLLAAIVPAPLRARWREEWLAEIVHASEALAAGRLGSWRLVVMAVGAIPDAFAARRLAHATSRRVAGPRARPFHALGQDLKHAVRALLASSGFALGVVASLTLGMAATTTAFSVVNTAVFRPFHGVQDQNGLVRVWLGRTTRGGSDLRTSYQEFRLLEKGLSALAGLSAVHSTPFAVGLPGGPAMVDGALVSGNYFQVLGMRPASGRFFAPDEDVTPGTHSVAVISDEVWWRHFNRDPATVGRRLPVNGRELRIVGVAAAGFTGLKKGDAQHLWVPLAMGDLALRDASRRPVGVAGAGPLWLDYIGRRLPGVPIEQVQAQAAVLVRQIDGGREPEHRGLESNVFRVRLNDPAESALEVLAFMIVPLLVLAVSCVNAANLLLARVNRRSRDWHVRLALGASRWRIVRQVLCETLVLALLAALAGVGLASAALRLVASAFPFTIEFPLDWRVMLLTLATVAGTAICCAVGPALHVSSRGAESVNFPARLGKKVSRSRTRFALIAVQAALSLGLLATGVQFTKTVTARAPSEAPEPDRLFIASFDLDPLGLDRTATDEFYARLRQRAALEPGVTASAVSLPGILVGAFGHQDSIRIWVPGAGPDAGRPRFGGVVDGDYFRAAGMRLLAGRDFTEEDAGQPVRSVIVTDGLARRQDGESALGRTFRVSGPGGDVARSVEVTVVGVVAGERPLVYLPAPLTHTPARALYVRTAERGQFTREALQRIVAGIDPRVPIVRAATLRQVQDDGKFEQTLMARGVVVLGVVSLVLAAGGLFSVVAYLVALRRHEIGVRMALGATGMSVTGLILRQALTPALLGTVLGAAGAAATGLLVRSRLHGAAPVDPVAIGVAAACLLLAAAAASIWPARQAARVDPMLVLREE